MKLPSNLLKAKSAACMHVCTYTHPFKLTPEVYKVYKEGDKDEGMF